MDNAVVPYLFTLGQISTTFVGFAALIMMFRQGLGGSVSASHSLMTLVFIELGFVVTAGSLLPELLGICGVPTELRWRVCSGALALVVGVFVATYHRRRRRVTARSAPFYVTADVLLLTAFLAILGAEALNRPFFAPAASYAVGLTGTLFTGALGYLHSLRTLHGEAKRRAESS